MARIARVVVPGLPDHVSRRGNRREPVFSGSTTIAFIGDWSPRRRGAAAPQSGPIA
jgi:putative transposase